MKKIITLIGIAAINLASACTIGGIIAAGSPCETSSVLGLTKQIAAEMTSMGIAFGQLNG